MLTKQNMTEVDVDSDTDLAEVGSLWARLTQKRNIDLTTSATSRPTFHLAAGKRTDCHSISSSEDEQTISKFESQECQENESKTKQIDISSENDRPLQRNESCVSSLNPETEPQKRNKRTTEEIEENRKKAKERKLEKENSKSLKEAEKKLRKIERECKKQTSLGSCLKYIKVLIDTNVVNITGLGSALLKACEDLGVMSTTEPLCQPYTILWSRISTVCNMTDKMEVETYNTEVEESEALCLVPVTDFINMVYSFKQSQLGRYDTGDGIQLISFIKQVKSSLPDKSITVIVEGVEQYLRSLKIQTQRNYREAVQVSSGSHAPKSKSAKNLVKVSRVDIEEAITASQLLTGSGVYLLETPEQVADLVKRFTKAVAERPAKKDRFDPVFSFHEEGSRGMKVDKAGHGLLKVWKHQLLQFKNVSPDVAEAIVQAYPSPQLLLQAYSCCGSEKQAIGVLENITVRRGAGVLETTRRIGKELSRRIHTFFTSTMSDLVIK